MSNTSQSDHARETRPQTGRPDLEPGETVTFSKALTAEDVRRFAGLTGDTDGVHLDDAFAARTRFEGPIVHETLLSGLISTAIARLPGLPISLRHDLEFLGPAHPGEPLRAVCKIVEEVDEQMYRLRTSVTNQADDVLVNGEVIVLIDARPETDDTGSS